MAALSSRFEPYVFAAIQSALTTGFTCAVAMRDLPLTASSAVRFLISWALAWGIVLPLVLAAAPYIRKVAKAVTGQSAKHLV
jgi:hypothetical protein